MRTVLPALKMTALERRFVALDMIIVGRWVPYVGDTENVLAAGGDGSNPDVSSRQSTV